MRYQATTGLDNGQIFELFARVESRIGHMWVSRGRQRVLTLLQAVHMILFSMRSHLSQKAIGELFSVSQSTVSRSTKFLRSIIYHVLKEEVIERQACAQHNRVALVDGTLIQTWNWRSEQGLYSGKHRLNGVNLQVASDDMGRVFAVGKTRVGSTHDKKAYRLSGMRKRVKNMIMVADLGYQGTKAQLPVKKQQSRKLTAIEKEINHQHAIYRSPIERAIAHLKNWKILSTTYRGPLKDIDKYIATIFALEIFRTAWKTPYE